MSRVLILGAIAFAAFVSFSSAGASNSRTFYVSPSGSDANPGTQAAPWKTIARVNRAPLRPGDSVLFQGGQTFTAANLIPPTSGTATAPIKFGSYGTGRAIFNGNTNDIWVPSGGHDLAFDNLDLTGSSILFASSASGPGTYDISLSNSLLHDTPSAGVNIAIAADHNWTLSNLTIRHTGDSGIISWGRNVSVTGSTFSDIGWNSQIGWAKHGIYDKGPDSTVTGNDFTNIPNGQAVSIRFHGAHVYQNTIHDTPWGIFFFDYDTTNGPQGTSYIYNNRLWNISGVGFYYGGQADPQGRPPSVSIVVANNTFAFNGASEAVNVSEVPAAASVTLANNIFTGSYGSMYRGCPTCNEFNNDWYGGTSNIPNGAQDQHANPNLTPAPALAPTPASPVVDAGTKNVPGLAYTPNCNGNTLNYCGASPDVGALEFTGTSVSPPAPTTTAPTTTTTSTTPTPPTTTVSTTPTPPTTTTTTTAPTLPTPTPIPPPVTASGRTPTPLPAWWRGRHRRIAARVFEGTRLR